MSAKYMSNLIPKMFFENSEDCEIGSLICFVKAIDVKLPKFNAEIVKGIKKTL